MKPDKKRRLEAAGWKETSVREFLIRAGADSQELGTLIDRYLEIAPIEAPDQETVVTLNARLEHLTPLTAARRRLPLKIDDVVERLRELLGLDESSRARLRVAYQELEAEQLDPAEPRCSTHPCQPRQAGSC